MNGLRRPRIGKNLRGWYIAITTWYGSYDVIEGFTTWDQAMDHLERIRYPR